MPRLPVELRLEAERAHPGPHWVGGDVAARASVAAEDQPASGRDDLVEKAFNVCSLLLGGHVHELGAHEVESPGRPPSQRVADEDPVGPLRETAPRELGERGYEVEPERLDSVWGPAHDRLKEVAGGAADVEERPVAVDRLDDRPPRCLPARFVAAEARLGAWVVAGEVRRLEDRGHGAEPLVIVELAASTRLGELMDFVPPVLLALLACRHLLLAGISRLYLLACFSQPPFPSVADPPTVP